MRQTGKRKRVARKNGIAREMTKVHGKYNS